MKIKRFNELNESLNSIFNYKPSYLKDVISNIIEIVREENKISEKDFKKYDDIIESTKLSVHNNQDILKDIEEHEKLGYRKKYSAEIIYHNYFR